MATSYGQSSVTTTPSLVLTARPGRTGFVIFNSGASAIFVGPDASITSTTGMQVDPHSYFQLNGPGVFASTLYAVTATGSSTINSWDWGS
jgi:hypothetical protein